MRGLVYTALFGGRDKAMPVTPEPGVDFVMWSDGPVPAGWQAHSDRSPGDPRMKARMVKVGAPLQPWADDYDWTLWIDASHKPTQAVAPMVAAWLKEGHLFAAYKHHVWDCTYTELRKCAEYGKDTREKLEQVANFFEDQRFPINYGQIASTILLRKQHDLVKRHALAWMHDMTLMSFRDQVSFMYEIWQLGYQSPFEVLKLIGPNAFKNDQFYYQGGH